MILLSVLLLVSVSEVLPVDQSIVDFEFALLEII